MQAEPSTRATALHYPGDMRSSTLLLPLVFILANDVHCKEESPAGGEFGDACGELDTPCGEGLKCYTGYCEEKCVDDLDCQPVDGYRHECEAGGVCHIYCDAQSLSCPDTLTTPLQCSMIWCEGAS